MERHDPELEALLMRHPGLADSRRHICRKGGLSAVLASGVFITRCEENPKVLLFELLYRRTVRLPAEASLAELEALLFQPLRRLRRPDAPRWWLSAEALQLVAASLERNRFAIVDGLLVEAAVQGLRETAQRLFSDQQMRAGIKEQRGGYGGYWGDGNEGDFQNEEGLPRKWTMEGDFRSWAGDDDARAPAVRLLTAATDALITALKDEHPSSLGLAPQATQRMRRVDFRESTMIACYPGETRGRYLRHCDTGRGAALTAILYLNESWRPEDGGQLRLYDEGFHNTQVKFDVLPVANRLLLFWATEECPHEVLPTQRDRFAMTIWYRDSSSLDAAGLADTMVRCTPVAPLSLEDAVRRAGPLSGEGERLELLAELRRALAQPDGARAAALAEVLGGA